MTSHVSRFLGMDQEGGAKRLAKYDLYAIPVVDASGALLGAITVDDVIDVLPMEQTRGRAELAGLEPSRRAISDQLFWTFIRKRAPGWWSCSLRSSLPLGAPPLRLGHPGRGKLSYYGPCSFRPAATPARNRYPHHSGPGGGEVKISDWWKIGGRELAQGIVLGLILACGRRRAVMMWGGRCAFCAADWRDSGEHRGDGLRGRLMLPLLLRRIGFDPATSPPVIASLVDVPWHYHLFQYGQAVAR